MKTYTISNEILLNIKKALDEPYCFKEYDECVCGYFRFKLESNLYISIYRGCHRHNNTPHGIIWQLHDVKLVNNKSYNSDLGYSTYDPLNDVQLNNIQAKQIYAWARKRCLQDLWYDEYGDEYEIRELVCPAIYQHFKHTEDGIINNYIYATMGISKPSKDYDIELKNVMSHLKPILTVTYTEENHNSITIYEKNGQYYHNGKEHNEELVIYKSLYSSDGIYAKSLDNFMLEVDEFEKAKYPVNQYYKFELVEIQKDDEY